MIKSIIVFGIILFGVLNIYVRMSKIDPQNFHLITAFKENADTTEVVFRSIASGDMATLVARVQATPRTTRLAGQVEDGKMTFVTRSLIWGFPDITTIWQDEDKIKIHARQRFGLYDFGVNAKRVDAWLASL